MEVKWSYESGFNMEIQRKRSLGRPKQRGIDKVEKNLAEIGIRDGETIAQDRARWKFVLR